MRGYRGQNEGSNGWMERTEGGRRTVMDVREGRRM